MYEQDILGSMLIELFTELAALTASILAVVIAGNDLRTRHLGQEPGKKN